MKANKTSLKWLSLLAWVGAGWCAAAAEGTPLELRGEWPGFTNAYVTHAQVAGTNAFITVGEQGLLIADVSDPANPRRVGSCGMGGYAYRVSVAGGYAYVAAGEHGLQIVDVRDRTHPAVVGNYPATSTAVGVDVFGNTAFLSESTGLQVINVSDPTLPKHLSTYAAKAEPRAVQVYGQYAYVRTRTAIEVVNAANLSALKYLLRLSLASASPKDMQVVDGKLFTVFFGTDAGLYILGLQNPALPGNLGHYVTGTVIPFGGDVGSHPTALSVANGYAYASTQDRKVLVFSVSNALSPSLAAEFSGFPSSGTLESVCVTNARVYVSAGALGVQILESQTNSVRRVGAVETAWDLDGVGVCGGLAFALDHVNGFQVLDVADPGHVRRLGLVPMSFDGNRLTVVSNTVLVADGTNGLCYLDVSVPSRPARLQYEVLPGAVRDLQIVDGKGYVACDTAGLVVLGMSNLVSPTWVGQYDTAGNAARVAVAGRYAYVADGAEGIEVVDVAPPGPIGKVAGVPGATAHGLSIAGNRAYAAFNGYAVGCYDLGSAPSLKWVQAYQSSIGGYLNDVHAEATELFAVYDGGIVQFGLGAGNSNAAPRQYSTPLPSKSVAAGQGYVYVAGEGGLKILADPGAAATTVLKVVRGGSHGVALSWSGTGTLQAAGAVTGPWTNVAGAQSPYSVSPSGLQRYFRVE
jgi:hypothetical protein